MSNYRNLLENWNKFLTEEEILDEVTEEELSNLDDILHNLDPQDLSFNNIFGDKMRLAQPMVRKDQNLESLKKLLTRSGYTPDFSTGLASYYSFSLPAVKEGDRPSTIILTPEQAEHLVDDNGELKRLVNDTEETFEKRKKKIQKKQIKIGKLLQKGARLYDNARDSWTASDEINPEDFGLSPDGESQDDTENVEKYRAAASELLAKSRKVHQKLFDVFQGDTSRATSALNIYKRLADWWNKKSAFYRENPEDAGETNSDYSIIYTRHPIDVMRMSDFENITSCHSPPSRPSNSGNSYYKCAVAEAHGHGPVAYVVRNEDLNELISKYGLEDADYQDLLDAIEENDEELFADSERDVGDITPISRVRIKKFVNPTLEISLGVPSTMVYGKKFPELYSNISNFTKEKQEKELTKIKDSTKSDNPFDNAFDEDGRLNLAHWERFGGSYQDAGDYPGEAMTKYLGYKTTGNTHYDDTTEDNLNVQGTQEEWQQEVNEIRERFNRGYQAAHIESATVEDDGGGEYYIEIAAVLRLVFPEDELNTSAFQDATRNAIDSIPGMLSDYGYEEFGEHLHYSTVNDRSQAWDAILRRIQDEEKQQVVIEIPIDIEAVSPEQIMYAYNPDSFREIAEAIDSLDDKADAIEEMAKSHLKREGVMKGSELIKFARALEDESWYEWDYDVDDDWNPTSIEVETTPYINFEDLTQKLPITLERANSDQSGEVYIMFAGDPLALASQASDGDGNFKWWEVRSPEFETDMLGGFKDLDEVKDYVRDQLTKLILRPKGTKIPKGLQSSHDYLVAVSILMRDAVSGKEGEFMFPNREMWVSGPDSDDEYKMMFRMLLDDDDSDEVVENAHQIMAEVDDEDMLKDIFRTAFAKVGKIPGSKATITEVKQYFKKFDIF